jgi:hypothetical protein
VFVIEATNEKGWRWISAICRERAVAENFLASIPDRLRPIQRIVEITQSGYPLFIVEDQGFEYGDATFVRNRLAQLRPCGNEDNILLNVYIASRDFTPTHPGKDSMGILDHWHITDDALGPSGNRMIGEKLQEAERNAV